MNTSDFDYDLPPDLIAQEPLPHREDSRMLVLKRDTGDIEHRRVADLPSYLKSPDCIVLNNTRVFPARIFGRKQDTGGRVEVLLVEETAQGEWVCLCRSGRRPRPGAVLALADGRIRARVLDRGEGGRLTIALETDAPLMEILEEKGVPPVPPYIRRSHDSPELIELDRQRYQTVYAQQVGAVAAPTAGLHLTDALLSAIETAGVKRAEITLHVGPGTFRPVSAETVEAHVMDAERYTMTDEAAAVIRSTVTAGGRVLAVGSTSVRTLETVAAEQSDIVACSGRTSLFIYPPYTFRAVTGMLTNFHLPRSTLLMMVSALGGRERVFAAYREAVRLKYRFYSYGDCMLIV